MRLPVAVAMRGSVSDAQRQVVWVQGSHWQLNTESGSFLISLNDTSCMKAMHGHHTQYVLSSATVCPTAPGARPAANSAPTLVKGSTEAPIESEHVTCDVAAPFQVLVSADSACIALIMHGWGVDGVPKHLKPLVLAAQRCGLTQDDVISAMPALLDNTTAAEMCDYHCACVLYRRNQTFQVAVRSCSKLRCHGCHVVRTQYCHFSMSAGYHHALHYMATHHKRSRRRRAQGSYGLLLLLHLMEKGRSSVQGCSQGSGTTQAEAAVVRVWLRGASQSRSPTGLPTW